MFYSKYFPIKCLHFYAILSFLKQLYAVFTIVWQIIFSKKCLYGMRTAENHKFVKLQALARVSSITVEQFYKRKSQSPKKQTKIKLYTSHLH